MSESPSTSDTLAAMREHLAEALAYLEAAGMKVEIDGDPLRYWIDGKPSSEGEIVALAARIVPAGSGRLQ